MEGEVRDRHMRILGSTVVGIVLLALVMLMNRPAQREANPIVVTAGAPPAAEAGARGGSADEDWGALMARADTISLRTYEQTAEPMDRQMALAQVIYRCGYRNLAWQQSTSAKLEEMRDVLTQPALEHMTEAGLRQTGEFNETAVRGETSTFLAHETGIQGCQQVTPSAAGQVESFLQASPIPL